jgi:hypothetical protein
MQWSRKYPFAALVILIIALNVGVGWYTQVGAEGRGVSAIIAWLLTVLLLVGCFAVIGSLPTGNPPVSDWKGVIIDQRNRISLSRFQLVVWTLLVVSAVLTEGTLNTFWLKVGDEPLNLAIPSQLWILLGLSAGSAVAAPIVLGTKNGTLYTNSPRNHAWSDMFYGDETGNYDQVDFSKVQQFFFTLILVVVYAVEITKIMMTPGVPPGTTLSARLFLPALDNGFLGLMAISQVAYISYKALPQNNTDSKKTVP